MFTNKFKTMLIVLSIFTILSVVVYYITYALGYGQYAVTVALAFSLLASGVSYWNSDKLVLKMNRARPATEAEQSQIRPLLERICINADIPLPKLYITEDSSPNAFATGRNYNHAVVCVTTGLLSQLNSVQLEGVLAHEVAHIKNYDILLSTIASVMIGAVIMISDIWSRTWWFSSMRSRKSDNDKNGANAILMIVGLVFIIIAPIAGQILRFALSRNREYVADATAAKFTHNPEGLASALEVIGGISQPLKYANNATANMYISDPIKSANGKKTTNLFSTHPPIEKRVEALRNLIDY